MLKIKNKLKNKISLFVFFLLTFISINAQIENYYQQKVKYFMNIDVDVKNYTYKCSQKIIYTNNSPDELNVFFMHLYWNAFQPGSLMDNRNKILGKEADRRVMTKINDEIKSRIELLTPDKIGYQKILTLKQNGKPLKFKVNETVLEIELNQPIKPNSSTEFEMTWEAQVPEQIRRSGRNNSEGIDLSMTQWYPKVVEYDYEGWHAFEYIGREFQGVFGDFDVKINIDANYIVGAGGQIQNTKDLKGYDSNFKASQNKKSTYHFKAQNIHDFAFVADPDYSVETQQIKNGPLVYYIYQKNEKTTIWEQAKPKIQLFFDLMNQNFGEYPYPTYSFLQGGDGGMEYGQASLITGESKDLKGLVGLMYHEAAHSWFQQIIGTNESMRGWMDEGFTSYAEDFCKAKAFPESVVNYPHDFFDAIQTQIKFSQTGKEEIMGLFDDTFISSRSYSMSRYIKGETFLVNLGYIVGEENLKKILKEYFQTWKFKHPTEKDFMHIAQNISKMDLKWYFNYMISSTKTIDYSIENVISKDKNTEINLKRIGEFPMPIDLMVEFKNGNKLFYTIALSMMRNEKSTDLEMNFKILDDWGWTRPNYTFQIPYSKEDIKLIVIDPTQRLADVNFNNNIFKNE